MSTVMVPAELVDLLREAIVCELAERAGAIQAAGDDHPDDGIDEKELVPFDIYRSLLRKVGNIREEPPKAVELDLTGHHETLVMTLKERLELERGVIRQTRDPDDPELRHIAEQNIRQIEAFMAENKLEVGEGAEEDVISGSALREVPVITSEVAQRAVVLALLNEQAEWTRGMLRDANPDIEPHILTDALARLAGAGAIIMHGQQVRPSRCTRHLGALQMVTV